MANFVEYATLKLIDETTPTARKITSALQALNTTAKAMRRSLGTPVPSPFSRVIADMGKVIATGRKINTLRIAPKVNSTEVGKLGSKLNTELNRVLATARKLNALRIAPKVSIPSVDAAILKMSTKFADIEKHVHSINALRLYPRVNMTEVNQLLIRLNQITGHVHAIQFDTRGLTRVLNQLERVNRLANMNHTIRATMNNHAILHNAAYMFGYTVGSLVANAMYTAAYKTIGLVAKAGRTLSDARVDLAVKLGKDSAPFVAKAEQILTQGAAQYPDVSVGNAMNVFADIAPSLKSSADALARLKSIPRELAIFTTKWKDPAIAAEKEIQFSKALILTRATGTDPRSRDVQNALLQQAIQAGQDVTEDMIKRAFQALPTALVQNLSGDAIGTIINMQEEQQRRATEGIRMAYESATRLNIAKEYMAAQKAAGIRDETGKTKEIGLLASDPFLWFEKYYGSLVDKAGINWTDTPAVEQFLQQFMTAAQSRVTTAAVTENQIILRDREKRKKVDLDLAATNNSISKKLAELAAIVENTTGPLVASAADAAIQRFNEARQSFIADDKKSFETQARAAQNEASYAQALRSGDPASIALTGAGNILYRAGAALLEYAGSMSNQGVPQPTKTGELSKDMFINSPYGAVLNVSKLKDWFSSKVDGLGFTPGMTFERNEQGVLRLDKLASSVVDAILNRTAVEPSTTNTMRPSQSMGVLLSSAFSKDTTLRNTVARLSDVAKLIPQLGPEFMSLVKPYVEADKAKRAAETAAANKAAEFDRLAKESMEDYYGTAINNVTSELSTFASSLRDANGNVKSYADQLAAIEADTIGAAKDKKAAFKNYTTDVANAASQQLGLKQDNRLGADDLTALGVKSIAELQQKIGAPIDNIFGPVTARMLETSSILQAATDQYKSLGAARSTGEVPIPTPSPGNDIVAQQQSFRSVIDGGISSIGSVAMEATAGIAGAISNTQSSISSAFASGAAIVASQIRAALATPVKVNVNTNSAKPLNTGKVNFADHNY